MIPKEIFQKIRKIEITTNRLVTDVFAGEYHSVFKGQGIEFDEVREYNLGDDIRTIDWNVTARTGKPHVKKYIEERELTVMILVDVSKSCRFGTVNALKSQLAAEVSALIAFSAIRNQDKVGVIAFSDKIERYIPPRKGSNHVLRTVRDILCFEAQNKGTNLIQAVEFLSKVTTRKTIAFIISDFLDENLQNPAKRENVKKAFAIANKHHDLVAITLNDPKERELPRSGMIYLEDAETHELTLVDASSLEIRKDFRENNQLRFSLREQLFKSVGMDFVNLSTDAPYLDGMVKFFTKRKRHRG